MVWTVPHAGRRSLARALAFRRVPSQVDPEAADPPPVSLSVPDVYDVDLDAESE